jgi:hypothetical protein
METNARVCANPFMMTTYPLREKKATNNSEKDLAIKGQNKKKFASSSS